MNQNPSFSESALVNNDLNCLWHPFTQMKEWSQKDPLVIIKGEGNFLIDINGNQYLDGVSSLWANIHGHGRKEINRAIKEQLEQISHSTLLGLTHLVVQRDHLRAAVGFLGAGWIARCGAGVRRPGRAGRTQLGLLLGKWFNRCGNRP